MSQDKVPAFPVVVGKGAELQRSLCGQPWAKVAEAAERGDDGLKLSDSDHYGMHHALNSEGFGFALREVKSLSMGNFAGLMLQVR